MKHPFCAHAFIDIFMYSFEEQYENTGATVISNLKMLQLKTKNH